MNQEEFKDYEELEDQEPERRTAAARIFRWLRRLATGLLILFLFLFLLVQIPFIQTWLVQQVARSLSQTLETTVRIDYLRLVFFDELSLGGFYVADYQSDTLLYSRELKADFNLNPITLLRKGLVVEEISLKNARFNLRRQEGQAQADLNRMLDRLFPPDTLKTQKKPFRLNLGSIHLEDVAFLNDDRVRGSRLAAYVGSGDFQFNTLDVPGKRIDLKLVLLENSSLHLEDFPESPLPEAVSTALRPREPAAADTSSTDTTRLRIAVEEFHLVNSRFRLDNWRLSPEKTTPPNVLDYEHLNITDLDIDIRNFSFEDWNFRGLVDKIALQEESGFVLNRLSVKDALVSPNRVELNGLDLITPTSHLGDTLVFKYREFPDFEAFPDRVNMDIRLHQASVSISDILAFAPGLEENPFFSSNKTEVLRLDGQVSGKINNLRGRDLNIELADGSKIVGNFSSRNLAVRNEELINLRLERLSTSMRTLRQLIPKFNPPANFDRLGRIQFSGFFDGFFVDFVAYGNLRTELGSAQMDMRMNLKQGRDKANYSGNLTLRDFDLGRWTGNPDFGKVTFSSKVINGVGITEQNARAILIANITNFGFKGYNYRNAYLEGELRSQGFNGNFSIQDDNVDLGFLGEINLNNGKVPTYEFYASIKKLDLKALNFSKKDLVLSGDMRLDLRNRRLVDLEGTARVEEFQIVKDQTEYFTIDSVVLSSLFTDSLGNRNFKVDSDILTADLQGRFDIQQVPEALIRFFRQNFPNFSRQLNIRASEKEINPNQFTYNVYIRDSKGINRLLDEKLGRLERIKLQGYFNSPRDSLKADLEIPYLRYGNLEFQDAVVLLDVAGDQGELEMAVDSTIINEKTHLPPIALLSILNKDTLTFGITDEDPLRRTAAKYMDLNGRFFVLDSNYLQVEFDRSTLRLFESQWNVSPQNYLRFGNKVIETKNFILTQGDRQIMLENVGRKGLKLSMVNLNFSYIDQVWDYEPLDFDGRYNVYALVRDVFEMRDISATAISDTLMVNGDDWGRLRFDARAVDLQHPFEGYLSITKDTAQLIAEGTFNPKTAEGENPPLEKQANYFDFVLNISGFPLKISEYFIGETVSNTTGSIDADLRFFGLPDKPNVEGSLTAHNGGVTIEYLKTRYTFTRSRVKVSNQLFDATGTVLRDKYGNRATVFGGVRHQNLRDLGFSARLSTRRFLALDTKKGDNNMFYGHALGEGEIWFSGSFDQPNIYVNATVGDSTELVIPVSGGAEASELSYIRFVDKNKQTDQKVSAPEELRGVSLEMDLRITEAAVVRIVFNEQTGDVIKGSGRGNIRIVVPRTQEGFQMFGDYVIESGDYLFTLYNVVNKSFQVRKGGSINWSGDAFGANIDLMAEYKGLNTSIANFIAEYLPNASPDLKKEATNSTEVNLTMHLRGELLRPIINFDISFPTLRGTLENYTDSKLRVLKQDQNELNKQVLGLIVAGQFIPGDINSVSGSEIIYNTVSEFVSNQLSLLLTGLFSDLIREGNVLSGINFDIAYNQFQSVDLVEGQDIRGDELQVRLRQDFFNDRLSILLGGNLTIGNNLPSLPGTTGTFFGNDLVIEYALSKDRSLKLRVYQLLEPDIAGRRLEVGTGLSYRKEYNSFGEFLNSLKNVVRSNKPKPSQ